MHNDLVHVKCTGIRGTIQEADDHLFQRFRRDMIKRVKLDYGRRSLGTLVLYNQRQNLLRRMIASYSKSKFGVAHLE